MTKLPLGQAITTSFVQLGASLGVHAVMGGQWSSIRGKVLAGIGIGVPARWVTPGLVDEVLAEAGGTAAGQRFRSLPPRLGGYFVLGLCLFSDRSCRRVR